MTQQSTHQLMRLYADILTELRSREVVRTRNAPAGDLAETIVARAYRGELERNSAKSWDIRADGRRLQVKARVVAEKDRTKQIGFSTFRSWDFEAAIFVVFSAETYDVVGAFEIGVEMVTSRAAEDSWVGGRTWTPSLAVLRATPGALDVTKRLREALVALP